MQVVHKVPAVQRCRDDGGAALVEAAFLTPVFFLILIGILEYGLVFRDYLTLGNGTLAGARMASVQGDSPDADFQIIKAVKKATSPSSTNVIKKLVVFKASGPASTISAACAALTPGSTSTTSVCNAYGPATDWAAVDSPTNAVNYNCTTPGRSKGYCPTSRNTKLGPGLAPDFVGVYLEFNHAYLTKMFGNSITLTDTTITQLEPQRVG